MSINTTGQFSFTLPLLPKGKSGNKGGILATSMQGVVKTTLNTDSTGIWVEARPSFIELPDGSIKWFDEWVTQFIQGEFDTEAKLLRIQDKIHGYHLPPIDSNHPEWVTDEDTPLVDIQLKGDLPSSEGWSLDGEFLAMEDYSVLEGPHKDKDLSELIVHEPGKRRLVNQVRFTLNVENFFHKEYKDQQTLMLVIGITHVDLITQRVLDFESQTIQEYLDACVDVVKPKGTGRKKAGLKLIQRHAQQKLEITTNNNTSDIDVTSMV